MAWTPADGRSDEERADRLLLVRPADRLPEKRRDGEHAQVRQTGSVAVQRNGVRDDELVECGPRQPIDRRPGEHRMRGAGDHHGSAGGTYRFGGGTERAGGVYDVVDDNRVPRLDLADDLDRKSTRLNSSHITISY